MEFSRQEYWSGWPFPSPADLPNPGIEQGSPALQADSLPTELSGKPLCGLRDPQKGSLGSPSIRVGGVSPGHPEGPAVRSLLRKDRAQTPGVSGVRAGAGGCSWTLLTWDPLPSNSIQTSPFLTAGFKYHPLQKILPLAMLPPPQPVGQISSVHQTPNKYKMQRTELGWGSPPRWVSDFTPHSPHVPLKGPAHHHQGPF